MKKKLGVILISALMLTTIIGGCGAKKEATAVGTPENGGVASPPANTGQPSATVAAEQASLQKIDPKTQQGQSEV